jgi:hypothetical protein
MQAINGSMVHFSANARPLTHIATYGLCRQNPSL